MTSDDRTPEGVYWALTTLVDDYALEISFGRRRTRPRLNQFLSPGTRVLVAARRRWSLSDVLDTAHVIARQDLRPIVQLAARDVPDRLEWLRVWRGLRDVGVSGVTLAEDSRGLATTLHQAVRLVSMLNLGPGRLDSLWIGVAPCPEHAADWSAELLRAFDTARAAAVRHDVDVSLLARGGPDLDAIVGWERAIRCAGNRLPIRVMVPGVRSRTSRRRFKVSRDRMGRPLDPAAGLAGLAVARDADRECLIDRVCFQGCRSLERTARVADALHRGCFVIEDDPEGGARFTLIRPASPT